MQLATEKTDNLNSLPDQFNTAQLIAMVQNFRQRIEALEAIVFKVKAEKPKKPTTRISNYAPDLLHFLNDGKIHSTYSLMEQFNEKYPDFAPFKANLINVAANKLVQKGKIERLASNTYRIIK